MSSLTADYDSSKLILEKKEKFHWRHDNETKRENFCVCWLCFLGYWGTSSEVSNTFSQFLSFRRCSKQLHPTINVNNRFFLSIVLPIFTWFMSLKIIIKKILPMRTTFQGTEHSTMNGVDREGGRREGSTKTKLHHQITGFSFISNI